MRLTTILPIVMCAGLYGCYGTTGVTYTSGGGYYGGGGTEVYATTPDLVEVSPGVQVIADYDTSVFYTDGYYWRFDNGYWYRSGNYANGWVYYGGAPARLRGIDRPYAYSHYRPNGWVARHREPYRPAAPIVRDHRDNRAAPAYGNSGPVVRDHREAPVYRQPQPAPAPVVRDHRAAPVERKAGPDVRDHRH